MSARKLHRHDHTPGASWPFQLLLPTVSALREKTLSIDLALCYIVYMSTQSSPSTTVTVRLPQSLEQRLAKLAGHTQRSKSWIAREAITTYVEHELAIVQGIEQGLADIEARQTVSHDAAMKRILSAATGK